MQRLNVAAYCRVSSKHDEQLNSLKNQVKHYREHINQHPRWKLVGIFSDKMSARTAAKRKSFQRMMRLCKVGKIDLILTKSIKRFGRNTLDLLQIFQELKMLNIDVYFEIEHLHLCDPNAELILTILASTAQQESEDLSFNIKWGIRHAFRSGTSKLITRPCYGYRKSDDGATLVIYEPEAKVVGQIFRWKRRGYSLRRISQLLQDGKIPSPSGKAKWGSETLNKLIHNEKYTGNVMLQKTFVPDMLSGKQVKNDGRIAKYYIENTHEGII